MNLILYVGGQFVNMIIAVKHTRQNAFNPYPCGDPSLIESPAERLFVKIKNVLVKKQGTVATFLITCAFTPLLSCVTLVPFNSHCVASNNFAFYRSIGQFQCSLPMIFAVVFAFVIAVNIVMCHALKKPGDFVHLVANALAAIACLYVVSGMCLGLYLTGRELLEVFENTVVRLGSGTFFASIVHALKHVLERVVLCEDPQTSSDDAQSLHSGALINSMMNDGATPAMFAASVIRGNEVNRKQHTTGAEPSA